MYFPKCTFAGDLRPQLLRFTSWSTGTMMEWKLVFHFIYSHCFAVARNNVNRFYCVIPDAVHLITYLFTFELSTVSAVTLNNIHTFNARAPPQNNDHSTLVIKHDECEV